MDLKPSPAELGGDIPGEVPREAAGHVHIGISAVKEPVQHCLKLTEQADLIKKDVVGASGAHTGFKIFAENVRIAEPFVPGIIEAHFDNAGLVNAGAEQIVPELREEQVCLAAAADACDYFDYVWSLQSDESSQA